MLLTRALHASLPGIARRSKLVRHNARGGDTLEYWFAVFSDKQAVHVINGRNGTIREMRAEDNLYEDWEPFQQIEIRKRKIKSPRPDVE